MVQKLILLALLGAVGTLARYWLQGVVQSWSGEGFPCGTLAVNVLGCFLFGVVWSLSFRRLARPWFPRNRSISVASVQSSHWFSVMGRRLLHWQPVKQSIAQQPLA